MKPTTPLAPLKRKFRASSEGLPSGNSRSGPNSPSMRARVSGLGTYWLRESLADPGSYFATAPKGILWFEIADELMALRGEAVALCP